MPRAKIADTRDYYTTRTAAARLGVSPYLVKARIGAGVFPAPTRISESGVILLDEAWLAAARQSLEGDDGAAGRRGRRPVRSRPALPPVPSPEEVLGYRMGTERRLPDWPEIVGYFRTLAQASDRVTVEELGPTTDGNPFVVVAVSDPANLTEEARARNRALLARLADPRGVADAEAEAAIAEARTVAIILATQHSTEIGAALMTLELAHGLAVGQDPTTRELLANTVTLLIPSANPDGIRIVHDWYARWLGTDYEGCDLNTLYHPYVGHDNNRDWFMLTQAENRLYVELHNREHPQLVFDMHQMYRDGARFMVPPFIDPLDPNQDPVIQQGFAALGSAIAARLTAAGKAGVATNIIFDNYSPSLAYGNYHGSVDLLSEAASCRLATPVTLEEDDLKVDDGFDPRKRTWNHPLPWEGGTWTLRDIVEYDLLAARAFLEHAAKYREQWLRDYLGIARRVVVRDKVPYAYVFPAPAQQPDPPTAAELLQTLARGAVEVEAATAPITADGVTYPAGTHVVRLAQPAGAFAKTLLEVQRYPELRRWPDGPPQPPYDISGHTLPIQMGVRAVEVRTPLDDGVAASLRRLDVVPNPVGSVSGEGRFGWAIGPHTNKATLAAQRLLGADYRVHRAADRVPGLGLPAGSLLVPAADGLDAFVRVLADETGIDVVGLDGPLAVDTLEQSPVRLGVYRSWKPAIDEGWCRWVLEEYGVPHETVRDQDVRQGDLIARFDALLLPHQPAADLIEGNREKNAFKEPYPPEYVGGLGDIGMAALQAFVDAGGTLVALGGAGEAVARRFALPVRNVVEGLPETDFYCPGSMLRTVVDTRHPLGWGLPRETAVLFLKSPVWDLTGGRDEGTVIARYPQSDPSLSGWILGPKHLAGKAALLEVPLGEGRVVLVGFRPQFRAQARGTYKVLFNALARAGCRPAHLELG